MSNTYAKDKVNWLRKQQVGQLPEVSVSDRTGLIKVDFGDRRSVMMYPEELNHILNNATALRTYCQENEDIVLSREASLAMRKASRQVHKTLAKGVQALLDAGFTEQEAVAIIKAKQPGPKAPAITEESEEQAS